MNRNNGSIIFERRFSAKLHVANALNTIFSTLPRVRARTGRAPDYVEAENTIRMNFFSELAVMLHNSLIISCYWSVFFFNTRLLLFYLFNIHIRHIK